MDPIIKCTLTQVEFWVKHDANLDLVKMKESFPESTLQFINGTLVALVIKHRFNNKRYSLRVAPKQVIYVQNCLSLEECVDVLSDIQCPLTGNYSHYLPDSIELTLKSLLQRISERNHIWRVNFVKLPPANNEELRDLLKCYLKHCKSSYHRMNDNAPATHMLRLQNINPDGSKADGFMNFYYWKSHAVVKQLQDEEMVKDFVRRVYALLFYAIPGEEESELLSGLGI